MNASGCDFERLPSSPRLLASSSVNRFETSSSDAIVSAKTDDTNRLIQLDGYSVQQQQERYGQNPSIVLEVLISHGDVFFFAISKNRFRNHH